MNMPVMPLPRSCQFPHQTSIDTVPSCSSKRDSEVSAVPSRTSESDSEVSSAPSATSEDSSDASAITWAPSTTSDDSSVPFETSSTLPYQFPTLLKLRNIITTFAWVRKAAQVLLASQKAWVFDRPNSKRATRYHEGRANFVKITRRSVYRLAIPVVPASRCKTWAKLPGWGKVSNKDVSQVPGHLWITPMKTLVFGKLVAQKKGYGVRYNLFYNPDDGFFETDMDGYKRPPKTFTSKDIKQFEALDTSLLAEGPAKVELCASK